MKTKCAASNHAKAGVNPLHNPIGKAELDVGKDTVKSSANGTCDPDEGL